MIEKKDTPKNTNKSSATKKDLKEFKEEIIHQFHLISEGLIDQIKLLAEGHSGIIEQIGGVKTRLGGVETRLEGVETRLGGVENRLDQVEIRLDGVETRLDRVETRLDGVETRLDHMEKENERQHLETRSLVKISFSELDRRLSNLESQVNELQEWRKEVEARLRT
jgi:chromosome segregation ATPase